MTVISHKKAYFPYLFSWLSSTRTWVSQFSFDISSAYL